MQVNVYLEVGGASTYMTVRGKGDAAAAQSTARTLAHDDPAGDAHGRVKEAPCGAKQPVLRWGHITCRGECASCSGGTGVWPAASPRCQHRHEYIDTSVVDRLKQAKAGDVNGTRCQVCMRVEQILGEVAHWWVPGRLLDSCIPALDLITGQKSDRKATAERQRHAARLRARRVNGRTVQ